MAIQYEELNQEYGQELNSSERPVLQRLVESILFLNIATDFLLCWNSNSLHGQSRDLVGGTTSLSLLLRGMCFALVAISLPVLLVTCKRILKESVAISLLMISLWFATTHFDFASVANTTLIYMATVLVCIISGVFPSSGFVRLVGWMFVILNVFGMVFRPGWAFVSAYLVNETESSALLSFLPVRLAGLAAHPTLLGGFAAPLALFVITTRRKWYDVVLFVALLLLIVLSQTKTSVYIIPVALMIWFFKWHPKVWFPMIVISATFIYTQGVMELHDIMPTITGRTTFWARLSQAFVESPLFGGGGQLVKDVTGSVLHTIGGVDAHSAPWQVAASGGLVGLAIYVALVYTLWKRARHNSTVLCVMTYMILAGFTSGLLPIHEQWIWCMPFLYFSEPVHAPRLWSLGVRSTQSRMGTQVARNN